MTNHCQSLERATALGHAPTFCAQTLMRIPILTMLMLASAGSNATAIELEDLTSVDWLCTYSEPTGSPCETSVVVTEYGALTHAQPDAIEAQSDPVAYAQERARLLLQPHEVVVAAADYDLLPYNAELGLISAPLDGGVSLWDGDARIMFPEGAVATFEVSQHDADLLDATHQLGALDMQLVFHLNPAPEHAYCSTSDEIPVIDATFVSAELFDAPSTISRCQTQTSDSVASQVRYGSSSGVAEVPRPVVMMTSMQADNHAFDVADITAMEQWFETQMVPCYLSGLVGNASLQGALVVSIDVGDDGVAAAPDVLIDALVSEPVRACVLRELEGASVPLLGESIEAVRATLVFRRD